VEETEMMHHDHDDGARATWRERVENVIASKGRRARRGRPAWRAHLRAAALACASLLAAAWMLNSPLAFAEADDGAEHNRDFNADHADIYQVQRGDRVCTSREACGGAAAVPMNSPGLWYLRAGMLPHPPVSAK
jgi:hypothetical protein